MKSCIKSSWVFGVLLLFLSPRTFATVINTGNITGSTTIGTPLNSNINSTPSSVIRFEVGGANYTTASGQLSISITVDAITPAVTVGTAANQAFRDDTVGASFLGYYLTTGVRTSNQTLTNMNIKIKSGTGATANRSYYLLGNGVTTPTLQSNLTAAPASATTFVTTTKNTVHCGPSYSANGLTSTTLNCSAGTTVANMDVTQFVKIIFTDPPGTPIISKLEFTAAVE